MHKYVNDNCLRVSRKLNELTYSWNNLKRINILEKTNMSYDLIQNLFRNMLKIIHTFKNNQIQSQNYF
jgi:hypothetical protein